MIVTVSGTLFLILTAGFVGIYYDNQQISDPGEVIKITGNYDLLQQTAFYSWPGDGTESNPIIIDSLHIYGITISETNLHFVLRNNRVTGINILNGEWKGGIVLNNVINGLLIDNEIIHYKKNVNHLSDMTSGILIIESRSIIARNNYVNYYPQGISIRNSENMIFSDNAVSNGINGVSLIKSDNILFKDGLIENNLLNGIIVESSNGNIFGGNTFKDNGQYSVILSHGTKNNVVTRNNMYGENLQEKSQASDSGFANEFLSNYWSDFDNTDLNADGFADYGYWISGTSDNKDPFPSATRIKLSFDFFNNLGVSP